MRALIGMSGGVDSSTAAYLMIHAGYQCIGATMRLYTGQDCPGCSLPDGAEDAACVCDALGIPFHRLDLSEEFQRLVMDAFVADYEAGLTPNPCIQCNRHLKFDLFAQAARKLDCDCIVTGHYAQITTHPVTGRLVLQKAVDAAKDQTYFLYTLTQAQLAFTRFPLGSLSKAQAREIAQSQGLCNAQKRDSQDICFVPDGDYRAFLHRYTGKTYPAGRYLDLEGNVLGSHTGAVGYTIGQRKGLGIALGAPAYVCSKNMAENTVTLGPNEALFRTTLLATDLNWMAFEQPADALRVKAKARSRMIEQLATVYPQPDGSVQVVFDEPQRALTPGQAVVFYDGDLVLGGGTVAEVL